MTNNKIQVELKEGGYMSILKGVWPLINLKKEGKILVSTQ